MKLSNDDTSDKINIRLHTVFEGVSAEKMDIVNDTLWPYNDNPSGDLKIEISNHLYLLLMSYINIL